MISYECRQCVPKTRKKWVRFQQELKECTLIGMKRLNILLKCFEVREDESSE
jgi:hypothetical protein